MDKKLPKMLYVYRETDRDGEEYLMCYETPQEVATLSEARKVGVYTLQNTGRVITDVRLVTNGGNKRKAK